MFNEISHGFQLPIEKLDIIPNGVNVANVRPAVIDPLIRQKYANNDEKLIIYVGRLVIEKGVQILIDSLVKLRHNYYGFKCLIAGKGPMNDELKRQVNYLGLETHVIFLGFVDDDTRNQLLAVSDVAVFPSLYEPFGIVALEAMTARIPVVVSNTGGLGEIISNRENGLKVTPGDCEALAQAILELFTNNALSKQIIEQAWEEVNTVYHWAVIAKQTTAVYEQVQKEAAAGRTVV
jgi:glycosyltransferase involved in cell wall biosynthesis